jgi:hypothetical protein
MVVDDVDRLVAKPDKVAALADLHPLLQRPQLGRLAWDLQRDKFDLRNHIEHVDLQGLGR